MVKKRRKCIYMDDNIIFVRFEKKDSNGRITKQHDEPPYYYEDAYSNFDIPCNWKGDEIVLPQFYTYEYLKKI